MLQSTQLRGLEMMCASVDQAEEVFAIERASYAEDEMASLESIRMRLRLAPALFLALQSIDDKSVVGFVNGTRVVSEELHHDCMTTHAPHGRLVVVHSVTIRPSDRRRGLATAMLAEYVRRMLCDSSIDAILLLSKQHLMEFYIRAGFSVVRPSAIAHGRDTWFEMRMDLTRVRLCDMEQVDAFTAAPFGGNPAAVVLLREPYQCRSDEWMQSLSAENNLAETAFVLIKTDGTFLIRWYAPLMRVPLARSHRCQVHAAAGGGPVRTRDARLRTRIVPARPRIALADNSL